MIDPSFCLQLLDHLISGGETHESSSLSVEGPFYARCSPQRGHVQRTWCCVGSFQSENESCLRGVSRFDFRSTVCSMVIGPECACSWQSSLGRTPKVNTAEAPPAEHYCTKLKTVRK
jgi:hypothetical protein